MIKAHRTKGLMCFSFWDFIGVVALYRQPANSQQPDKPKQVDKKDARWHFLCPRRRTQVLRVGKKVTSRFIVNPPTHNNPTNQNGLTRKMQDGIFFVPEGVHRYVEWAKKCHVALYRQPASVICDF